MLQKQGCESCVVSAGRPKVGSLRINVWLTESRWWSQQRQGIDDDEEEEAQLP